MNLFILRKNMSKICIKTIFKDSINKLNSMISRLDTQLGIISFQNVNENKIPANENTIININNIASENQANQKELKEQSKKPSKPQPENKKNDNNNTKKTKEEEEKEAKLKLYSECDLRVGHIVDLKYMENSQDIYRLKIDLGEGQPREIGSGLRKYVKEEELLNTKVIVFANLKPKKLGDFFSNGMVLSCCKEDHSYLELIRPAANAAPGENVRIEGLEYKKELTSQINDKKFKKAMALFKSNEDLKATYSNMVLNTISGPITTKSLKNSPIS